MNAIAKAIDAINELFGRIIAPLIAIITLIVLYDIVSRFFFGRPSDWAFDVTKMLFGAHFMLMAACGSRRVETITVAQKAGSFRANQLLGVLCSVYLAVANLRLELF